MINLLKHDEEDIFILVDMSGQWDNLDYGIAPWENPEECWDDEFKDYDFAEFKLGSTSLN